MDLCKWDWGAIGSMLGAVATFTAAGVALYIFNKWRYQKASEVVANEAKSVVNEIFELNKILLELSLFHFNGSKELQVKITSFISLTYSIFSKLTFIQNSINDEHGKLRESIESFNKVTLDLIEILTTNLDRTNIDVDIFRSYIKIITLEEDNKLKLFKKLSEKVLENCKNIAIYKLKI